MSKKLISLDELNRFKQKEDIEISKACGGLKGIYNTLSALQTAYPSGTNGAFLVTSNNHWYYWNGTQWTDGGAYQVVGIADGEISYEKLDAYLQKNFYFTNLFDKTTNTLGGKWSSDGTLNTYATNSYYSEQYMPVKAGKKYKVLNAVATVQLAYYNASKTFVSLATTQGGGEVITIPSGISHLRISQNNNSLESIVVVEVDNVNIDDEVYGAKLDASILGENKISKTQIKNGDIEETAFDGVSYGTITQDNYVEMITYPSNVYIGGNGDLPSNANYTTKYFIAKQDFEIWFDSADDNDLILGVWQCLPMQPETFLGRYRGSNNTLPTSSNKLSVKKGQVIGFAFETRYPNFKFNTSAAFYNAFKTKANTKINGVRLRKYNANGYYIYINNYEIPFFRRIDDTYNVDNWNIDGNSIFKTVNGSDKLVCPQGTDILGVLKEQGQSTHIGGVHGYEHCVYMKIYADGKEVTETTLCNSLDIVMYSHLYRPSDGTNVVDRFVRINFKDDTITVETTFKCVVDNFNLVEALNGGMFAWRAAYSKNVFINCEYYDLTTLHSVSRNHDIYSITVGLNNVDAEFTVENIIGKENDNYVGEIYYYSNEGASARLKIYYTIDKNTTWNNGHICNGKCKYILR